MSMSSHGATGSCEKYRRLQELDKCERVIHGLQSEKRVPFGHKYCARVICIGLAAAAIFLAGIVVYYLVILKIKFSKEIYLCGTEYIEHNQSALFDNTSEDLEPYPEMSDKLDNEKVVSCYYSVPKVYGEKQLMPSNINPQLCTHINVAFAHITNKEIVLDESIKEALLELVKLKHQNSKLKIILSVGGAGNDHGFSDMVVDHASRKIFIRSIKKVLSNYTLDGIDLDWEFPALHNRRGKIGGREKQHFSQLLREIRMEFFREKKNYILTVATASPEMIVDVSYDVDQINMYVDYVNIMTYDFHYYTKYTPFTGFNSPLYQRSTESLYLATLNINYTINMYIGMGLDRNKIVVGVPTYGHTFTLMNVNNPNVGSPVSGVGSLGSLGFINYPDICVYLRDYKNVVQVKYDEAARVPYLYWGKEWVSYDNPQSVMEKATYIKEQGLRGAMIYSLNADDYEGECEGEPRGAGRFPLAQSVRNALMSRAETNLIGNV